LDTSYLSIALWRDTDSAYLDAYLGTVIAHLPKQDYTVIYATTPRQDNFVAHETDTKVQDETLHVQHRRNSHHQPTRDDSPGKTKDKPLFETYQFLSPGSPFSSLSFHSTVLALLELALTISTQESLWAL
jgi:hypothetical protein